jgi:hypothetical protein
MIRRAIMVMLMTGFTCSVGLFAQQPSERDDTRVYNVSLIRLIGDPNDFNGQRLRIVGYLGHNGIDKAVGVYVSEVDGRNFVLSNSVDLHVEESIIRGLTGKYIVFSGTYHAPSPRSGYNGYVDQIVDLKLWNVGDVAK